MHLSQWRKLYLPFALGGDTLPAAYITNCLLGTPPPSWMPETCESGTHDNTVDVCACRACLVADQLKEMHISKELYLYVPQIRVMSEGERLWDLTT